MVVLLKILLHDTFLNAEVQNKGKIGQRKGVNLPKNRVEKPVLTKQDEADLGIGVEEKVDMVFASFIQSAEDVQEIRRVMHNMGDTGERILVISKVMRYWYRLMHAMKKYDNDQYKVACHKYLWVSMYD